MAKERNDQAIPAELDRIMAILGGCATMGQEITNGLDVHKMIERGFPKLALRTLVENVHFLQNEDSLRKAIGISKRTYSRKTRPTAKSAFLTREQSGQIWKLAKVLVKAANVFGSQNRAEEWMEEPAYGLDLQRPIDLVSTAAGIEMVEAYLDRECQDFRV